ncbi:Modifying wall lignin-1/2 protein [Dioscorea alata]|uniref:Modifying wall lignin-1/2 protein n=1 Tax=Dioscorea alata TaxID=55571 RepID=A0ACB7VNM9_DIOAL|nr:Modifying wall lignin-1/2 protein [Dioscorea alata]
MWNLKLLLVCLSILVSDIVAGLFLGLMDSKQDSNYFVCFESSACSPEKAGPAYKLGIASAVLMGLTLVVSDSLSKRTKGCTVSHSTRSSPNMKVAAVVYWFSWAIALIAIVFLGIGANNDYPGSHIPCSFSKCHFLTVGGVLCFVDGVACVISQVSSASANA